MSNSFAPLTHAVVISSVKMLKKDKNGSPEWLSKLPQMAKQLEVSLYRNARSFEAYMDMATLKQRLQQIAVEVSRKARHGDQRDSGQRDRQLSSGTSSMRPDSSNGSPFMGVSNSAQHQSLSSSGRNQLVNPSEINAMANSNVMNMGSMTGNIANAGYQAQRSLANNNNSNRLSNGSGGAPIAPGSSQNRNDPEWKIRIRHKQQRLLLLHHSAKCPHEDGRCNVTPHCADMKRLWKHMEGCKDNQCRVAHCFSSRAILSHYRKCKDPACPACGPVRETVRKSQNRPSSTAGGLRSPSAGGKGMSTISNARMMSSSNQQQQGLQSTNDVNVQRGDYFSSSSMGQTFQQSQQSQSGMPPPSTAASANSGTQFPALQSTTQPQQNTSQQFRSMSANPPPSSAVQPLYVNNTSENSIGNGGVSGAGQMMSTSASMTNTNHSSSSQGSSAQRNDSEWQKVRHKQQRLLLLRHASRCQYTGKCPVTPHCASMKKLWEHIAHCKDHQCSVPHCMSSRYVLSHYRRCKDARCPACAPVRETIRKSHEKEKERGQGSTDLNAFEAYKGRATDVPSGEIDPTPMGPPESSPSPDYQSARKRSKIEHTEQGAVPMSETPHAVDSTKHPGPLDGSAPIPQTMSSAPTETAKTTHVDASDSRELQKEPEVSISKKIQGTASKTSEDRSLLNGFTVEELSTHLSSLNRASQLPPAKLKQKCSEVLKGLQTHQHGWVFNCPVDPVELGLPDYFDIIKKPMDLGTIHKKLDSGVYHAIDDFQADVHLTFDNAMAYNEKGTVVYDMAKELKAKFVSDYKRLESQLDAEDRERRQNERACVLCGCEKRLFEPPVFFCNGLNCASKRIRRNSHFYIGGNNQYFWCNQCFNELDENTPIELVDLSIQKAELKRKKNDEVHEESWVQCDVCNRWIHQICGLFNTRQNKEHHSEYCCPLCLLEKRKHKNEAPPPKPPGAGDLPRTKLSEFLENHLSGRIDAKRRQMAEEKSKNEVSSYSFLLHLLSRWLNEFFY